MPRAKSDKPQAVHGFSLTREVLRELRMEAARRTLKAGRFVGMSQMVEAALRAYLKMAAR